MSSHRFPWDWRLADLTPPADGAPKVLSTFACGGGSSMGYKLAGYDVVGCVEIDPRMLDLYERNLHPRRSYLMDVRDFARMGGYPDELVGIDVLDGSPPCTVFSDSGPRQKSWGKARSYAEGATVQTLDDLFMAYLDVVDALRPKAFIAENVTGLLHGNAKGYLAEVLGRARSLGYAPQVFKLNSALMGVPQQRERVFVIANRMGWPRLELDFDEDPITFGEVRTERGDEITAPSIRDLVENWWRPGEADLAAAFARKAGDPERRAFFNTKVVPDGRPSYTITSSVSAGRHVRACDGRLMSAEDIRRVQTFPRDYDFGDESAAMYVCGMSVPPVMMANIAYEVRRQWLDA